MVCDFFFCEVQPAKFLPISGPSITVLSRQFHRKIPEVASWGIGFNNLGCVASPPHEGDCPSPYGQPLSHVWAIAFHLVFLVHEVAWHKWAETIYFVFSSISA